MNFTVFHKKDKNSKRQQIHQKNSKITCQSSQVSLCCRTQMLAERKYDYFELGAGKGEFLQKTFV